MIRTLAAWPGLVAVTAYMLLGQTVDRTLTFDTASVKVAAPLALTGGAETNVRTKTGQGPIRNTGGPGTDDPGRIHYPRVTLKDLLIRAGDVQDYQIVGPGWLNEDRFAIDATMPSQTTQEQFQMMLRNLLTERFKMTIHWDTREIGGYSLVVSKKPKMNGSSPVNVKGADGIPLSLSDRIPIVQGIVGSPFRLRWTGSEATMEDLATKLTGLLHRPVANATALSGRYNFTLNFSSEANEPIPSPTGGASAALAAGPSEPEPLPNIFSALQSIGLKLEPKKTPVRVIVVDHIEKVPTRN